jgi:flagellar hook protein FlgE
MVAGMSTALSGLNAASTRLDSAAHNIANAQTPDFRREVVKQQTVGTGQGQEQPGVLMSIGKSSEMGADLAADLVEQMQASATYKANLQSIRTQDKLMGSLLDMRA